MIIAIFLYGDFCVCVRECFFNLRAENYTQYFLAFKFKIHLFKVNKIYWGDMGY